MTFEVGATEYVVTCDYPGCNAEGVHHTYTKRDAKREFEEKGWRISSEKCYCPEHNKKEGKE